VAALVGISVPAAQMRMDRARKQLKRALAQP